jgi:lipopolysaccharide/colanic/teichoic acid biosynthesis glycosyltransferase
MNSLSDVRNEVDVQEFPEKKEKERTAGGKAICITSSGTPSFLSAFSSVEIVAPHQAISRIESLTIEDGIDVVIFNSPQISERFFALLKYASEVLREIAVPLIVKINEPSDETKKEILKHGADDCCVADIKPTELARWVSFLKHSKEMLKEAAPKPVQVNSFSVSPVKRMFDILISSVALILLSPIMALIALVVKLESSGPVFYISKRAGSGYKVFNFLKFRTMRVGADVDLDKLKHLNQYNGPGERDSKSVFFKIKNDPRITRIGNFLRNTSLDELPQLINVLKGDMSIVGNRPLPLYEAQQLTKDQCAMRFMTAAGITGLWQVTKRGKKDLSDEERIALDVAYAKSNSFPSDIMLIVKTFPALTQEVAV